jgi:pimeloyl-ACP methyl ester carboxylesterase
MPQRTVELMQARATLASSPRTRSSPTRASSSSTGSSCTASAPRRIRSLVGAGGRQATFGPDRLGSLAAPTLVQHGDGDLVVDPRNADLLAEAIPDARVSIYSGCGHLFMWQEPERFVRELEEFLC